MARNTRTREGFTLLELLTVIVIMFLMMGIGVTAYFGLIRSAGLTGAVSNVRSVLLVARQFAITHQTRVFVLFSQDSTHATLLSAAQAGVASGQGAGNPATTVTSVNDLPWQSGDLVGGEVVNLDDGSFGVVTTNTSRSIISSALAGGTANRWRVDDRIGFAVNDREVLPRNIFFGNGAPSDAPDTVVFNPDGTTGRRGSPYDIVLREKYVANPDDTTVRVHALTGRIEIIP